MGKKKSRKIGKIGIPKSNIPRQITTIEKPKMKTGKKSGSRQQVAEPKNITQKKAKENPKLGSKVPIDLNKYKGSSKQIIQAPEKQVRYNTPQDELDAIENNKKLDTLLEKQANEVLSASEQAYVEKLTSRYRVLCELIGIDTEYVDDQKNTEEDDPFASLDAIKLEDFKDL